MVLIGQHVWESDKNVLISVRDSVPINKCPNCAIEFPI